MTSHLIISFAALLCLSDDEMQQENTEVVRSVNFESGVDGSGLRLALAPDGSSVFVASDKSSQIWEYDSATGKMRQCIDTSLKYVWCLQISPDGTMLAAGGDGVMVFEIKKKKELIHNKQSARVNSVAFSTNNLLLAFGTTDKSVKVLSLPEGKGLRSFVGSSGPVMCVAFTPDGEECGSGGIDQSIRVWDVKKGTEKQKIPAPLSVTSALSYSPDGRYLAYSGTQQIGPLLDPLDLDALNVINVWDRNNGKVDCTIADNMAQINSLFVGQNAQYVIAASRNGMAFVWKRDNKKAEYLSIWKNEKCTALTVSRNFQKMATAKTDGTISVWELRFSRLK